jgi:hypothetical protein
VPWRRVLKGPSPGRDHALLVGSGLDGRGGGDGAVALDAPTCPRCGGAAPKPKPAGRIQGPSGPVGTVVVPALLLIGVVFIYCR